MISGNSLPEKRRIWFFFPVRRPDVASFSHGLFPRAFPIKLSHVLLSRARLAGKKKPNPACFSHGLFPWSFPTVHSHGPFPRNCPWLSHGFSHGPFPWFFPRNCPWLSHGIPTVHSHGFSHGPHCRCFPTAFPRRSHGLSHGVPTDFPTHLSAPSFTRGHPHISETNFPIPVLMSF